MMPPAFFPQSKCSGHSDNSCATKDYHCATDTHLRPDKPWGATGKSLIALNPWLSLNQRVPGSSPGAPTKPNQSMTYQHSVSERSFQLEGELAPF